VKTKNFPFFFFWSLQEDLVCPRTWLQNVVWTSLYKFAEPVLSSWPVNKLRDRALGKLMEHIHYEDENTQYICICAVNKVSIHKSWVLFTRSVVRFLSRIMCFVDWALWLDAY
jgi:hypothetical protein